MLLSILIIGMQMVEISSFCLLRSSYIVDRRFIVCGCHFRAYTVLRSISAALYLFMIEVLKPWTLKKDLRQISPFRATSESYCKVKNIEGLIINSRSS